MMHTYQLRIKLNTYEEQMKPPETVKYIVSSATSEKLETIYKCKTGETHSGRSVNEVLKDGTECVHTYFPELMQHKVTENGKDLFYTQVTDTTKNTRFGKSYYKFVFAGGDTLSVSNSLPK